MKAGQCCLVLSWTRNQKLHLSFAGGNAPSEQGSQTLVLLTCLSPAGDNSLNAHWLTCDNCPPSSTKLNIRVLLIVADGTPHLPESPHCHCPQASSTVLYDTSRPTSCPSMESSSVPFILQDAVLKRCPRKRPDHLGCLFVEGSEKNGKTRVNVWDSELSKIWKMC